MRERGEETSENILCCEMFKNIILSDFNLIKKFSAGFKIGEENLK